MKTLLTHSPTVAAGFIRRGGIVAFPTETVYGLGANVFDEAAIGKIFEAKQRPADNPLITHIAGVKQIRELAPEVTENTERLIKTFFPGPLTIVLRKNDSVPLIATAGLDTIGVRMPRHSLATEFLEACGVSIAAPSANLSGRPSPTTWQAVLEDLEGRIDCILQGEATEIGLESTVVDCTGEVPMLLRRGAISLADLQSVVPESIECAAVADDAPRSPGMKHRHYTPRADVFLVDVIIPDPLHEGAAYIGLNQQTVRANFSHLLVCESVEKYAHAVFEFFRECDRLGIHTIYCEEVPEAGIGAALMDRLRRAEAG